MDSRMSVRGDLRLGRKLILQHKECAALSIGKTIQICTPTLCSYQTLQLS